MTRILLVRGMFAGLVAGLLVFALARWIGEPQVERAIAFETAMDPAKGEAPEPKIVSRKIQGGLGLLTATVVDGTTIGGIFALVFAFVYGRMQLTNPRALAALVAGLRFVILAVVPDLESSANPPSMGSPDTIGVRAAAFFLLLAFSIAAMILTVKVERHLQKCLGGWNVSFVAVVFFVVVIAVVSRFPLNFNEVPPRFPVAVMWKFGVAPMEMQMLLWSILGFLFWWLADMSLRVRPLHS